MFGVLGAVFTLPVDSLAILGIPFRLDIAVLASISLTLASSLGIEVYRGRSPGNAFARLVVCDRNGNAPSRALLVRRWAVKHASVLAATATSWFCVGSDVSLLMTMAVGLTAVGEYMLHMLLVSNNAHGLHDLICGTFVVSKNLDGTIVPGFPIETRTSAVEETEE